MLYLDKYQTSVLVTSFVESLFVYLALAWEGLLFFSLCPLEGDWERGKKNKRSLASLLNSFMMENFLRINLGFLYSYSSCFLLPWIHKLIFMNTAFISGKLQDGSILYWVYFYNSRNKCRPDNLKQHPETTLSFLGENNFQTCNIIIFDSHF